MVTGREKGPWYPQSSLWYQGSEWGPLYRKCRGAQTAAQGASAVKLCDNGELLEQAGLLPSPFLHPTSLHRPRLAIWGRNFMLHPLLLLNQVTSMAVLEGTT